MAKKRLYLIDATAFCYRAFYALGGLATSFGQPTNAIYGFLNILNKILKEEKPEYLGACFDVSRDTFRTKKFAEYKIQRPPMPDGLSSQIPLIKEVIRAYGIPIFEKEGFEADDVIATLAKKAKDYGLAVTIVSSDKDILQLVDDDTVVFSPYKEEGILYDRDKVLERFGVLPERIVDLITLMGDSADNIPSIPGIGEKTAVSLILSFGSLGNLLENIDGLKQEKLKKSIQENIKTINLNRELAVLDRGVDLEFGLDKLRIGEPDYKEIFRLFKYLEFKKFLKGLPEQESRQEEITLSRPQEKELRGIKDEDEIILSGLSPDELILHAQDKFFKFSDTSVKDLLNNPVVRKTGHDLKKIKVSLARHNIKIEGLYFDTMIASYLLNPSKASYDLADLSWDYLGEVIDSKAIDNQHAAGLVFKLKPKLEEELEDKKLSKLFRELEMPLVEVLAQVELNGAKLDLKVLKELSGDIEKRLIGLIQDIYDLSGAQFNINSPKQLREILFERLKLPVLKKSKTGPSTDEEVLRGLADKHKLPALLLEYRQLTKLKNTYIDTLPQLADKDTGRIHTSFNQAVTETGRLSSSNPNLQNIPIKTDIGRNIRRSVVASGKDYALLSCDYSQIELRILAHLSGDRNLIAAFKDNQDIHKATAALIYGLEEKDVTGQMRDVAKRVNFGIVYGLTFYGLSRDLGIPAEEAQDFIDAYFTRYPGVKDYIEKQIQKAEEDGFVTTILGRRRYIPEIRNKNQGIRQFAQRQAVNTPIQGSASDLIKLAMVHIHEKLKEEKLRAMMIMQIHDELVFDVPREELQRIVTLAKDRMENVLKLDVPVKVDIKKGQNWLEMEEVK